jgi:hypothetical protein
MKIISEIEAFFLENNKYSEKNFIFSLQLPFSHDIITLKKAVHISAEKGVKRHA